MNRWEKYRSRMLKELSGILGTQDLPPVFLAEKRPKALKTGIFEDLTARYPDCDHEELKAWLGRWTRSHQYLQRIAHGLNRHDLEGNDCGEISTKHAKDARRLLSKRKARQGAQKEKTAA